MFTQVLGDLPLLFLTAGVNAYEDSLAAEVADAFEDAWLDSQRAYAGLSTLGEQRNVADHDHVIHVAWPDLILAEIKRFSAEACEGSSSP